MFTFPTAQAGGFEYVENPNDNTVHRFLKGAGWLPSEAGEVIYQYVYSVPNFFPYICKHQTGELGASEVMFPYVLEPDWMTSVWEVKRVQRPGNIEINQVAFPT
ncbi:MAG: hypothetical protein OSB29_00055 [Verrucomicrobiota bacterium]|nr:hypothetical protein [Verrucomicrobiota bacterium]